LVPVVFRHGQAEQGREVSYSLGWQLCRRETKSVPP